MAVLDNPINYGDLKKFVVTVDGNDISQGVTEARIFQDIFTPCWTGTVTVDDKANWLMRLPIKLGSVVTIDIETVLNGPGDGEKTFTMMVYSIANRQILAGNHQAYVLMLATEDFLINQKSRVSRSYNQVKATDAVADIISNNLTDSSLDNVDSCDNSVSTIIPNISPFNAIAWFCKHATFNNAADYVFFQQDENSYTMKSMENLYASSNNSCGITFTQYPAGMKDDTGAPLYDYSVSMSQFQVQHFDGMANLSAGMYKNKKVSFDYLNKTWSEKIFTYGDDCPQDAQYKSWDTDFFDDAEDSNITFMPKHPGMASSGPSYLDAQDTWEPSRKTAFMKLEQEKLIFQVPGSVGFWKCIGKNCVVNLPSHQDFDTGNPLDKYRKGNYLISAIAHIIGKDVYVCNFECLKKRMEAVPEQDGQLQ